MRRRLLEKLKPGLSASQSAAQTTSHPTPQPTPSPPTSADSTSSLLSLQERLWNQAYDKLKASEPKVVRAYEEILSAELCRDGTTSVTHQLTENKIGEIQETRHQQMLQLVHAGLDRTQKEVAIKGRINKGLQAVQAVRGIVDKAVQAAPQAAVAWVGVCLGLEMLSNPVTEAHINRQGIAYILSRMEWYWNLVCLLLDKKRAEQPSMGLQIELENHIVLLYQKLLHYQMKSVCLYRRNEAAVIGRDLLKLDNWAGQLREIQLTEAAIRADAEQYNSEENKIQLWKLNDTACALETSLQDIHSAIQDQTQQQERRHQDDKDKQCLKDLYMTDPSKDKERIQDTKGGLLRDSYSWILEHPDFARFRDDPQNRLLWIKGDPGKGKTMLLCGIIDELNNLHNPLSYFFCQATETQLSNATSVLRGLIYLLIVQQPPLIAYVRAEYDIVGEKLFQGINAWVSLAKIFTNMLNDPFLKDIILIVDALDECTTDRPKLLDFIIQSSLTVTSCVKWIISSRNWPEIEEKLANVKQKLRLHLELNKDSVSGAVNKYIEHKVDQLARNKGYDKETRDAVQNHLTANADGTFLWVALVCQELADPKIRNRHTLSKLKNSFPPGLDSLYTRMMEHIDDSEDVDHCKAVLAITSVVYQPVTLAELKVLAESLKGLNQADLEEIISSCGSFLTLQEGIISFVHQSAKDYLLEKASNKILPSGVAQQHYVIFSRSLEALSEILQRDIYSLSTPGFPASQISTPDPDPLASIRYSCIYWVEHLCDSKDLQNSGIISDFIQKKYLYWLESLSLLSSMSEGVMAVLKLENIVRSMKSRKLIDLLQDACRFILYHKWVIENWPLQIYISALVFSPSRSLIRSLFKEEEPKEITVKPAIGADWSACLQTLEGHSGSVISVAFSYNRSWLASGSSDSTVKIWNTDSGQHLQTLEGHGDAVMSVAFLYNSLQLASGSSDNTVKIWDTGSGQCLQTLEGHSDSVSSVAFSHDSLWLASGSYDNTVKIWDTSSGQYLQILEDHSDSVSSVAFSHNSSWLVSASHDNTVKIWDAGSGQSLQTLKGHSSWVRSVAFSHDSSQLVSASDDKTVKIWNTHNGQCLQTLGHSDIVWSVVFLHDTSQLASGSFDNTVKIWDTGSGQCLQTLEGHSYSVISVAFSHNSSQLASGSYDNTVKIWNTSSGQHLQTLEGHSNEVRSVALSHNSSQLASGSSDNTVKIWDTGSGQCLQTLEGHGNDVCSVAFSHDSLWLASASLDNTVKIWDAGSGQCLQTLRGHSGTALRVAFSHNSSWLASGSGDNTVKIWDTGSGQCLQTLSHGGVVWPVTFSHDSLWLASGSCDSVVKIWNTGSGQCLQTLEGHSDNVTSVAFSHNSSQLASGSSDNTVKIWDTGSGQCLQTLSIGTRVSTILFDTTGSYLCTEFGTIAIKVSPGSDAIFNAMDLQYQEGALSLDRVWITYRSKNLLWLPSEYRPSCLAVSGKTIGIGVGSGRVWIYKLRD